MTQNTPNPLGALPATVGRETLASRRYCASCWKLAMLLP